MNWKATWNQIDARIARALGRVQAARRMVLSAVNGTTRVPELDGEGWADQPLPGLEYFQHFGFRSVPPVGAEAIALQIGGAGGHLVVVACADRATAPVDMGVGDAAIFSSIGARVLVRADGSIDITTPSGGAVQLDAAGQVLLNAGVVGVARLGDTVSFTGTAVVASGSSAGTWPVTGTGTITSASATVKAGG
jgi:phage gp45-like